MKKKQSKTTPKRHTRPLHGVKNWTVIPKGTPIEKVAEKIMDELDKKPKRSHHKKKAEPAPKPKPVRTKTKKKGIGAKMRQKVVARTDLAPPEAKQQLGNEERLAIIVRRATYLHGFESMPYREIAATIQKEFSLTYLPTIPTVCRWMTLGKAEFLDDINEMRAQLRMQQFNEVEDLKNQWLEAARRNLLVRRFVVVDGKPVEEVDEDAFKEHAKAAEIFLKCLERQAKLIGLDFETEDNSQGKRQSPQEIYLFIQNMLNTNPQPKIVEGKEIKTFAGLELVLDSGKPSPI